MADPEAREVKLEDTTRALREKADRIADAPSAEAPAMPAFPETAQLRDRAREAGFIPKAIKPTNMSGLSKGYALAIEFLVFLLVCGGAGWAIDTYVVGSGSLWTVIGGAFGLCGAIYRAYKASQSLTR
ncbi:MAG TPA: AtpZ/AtpI family protein [Phycisphaerales bacterium]|nr:AtpZ/AtpI family protein [Phycisphaerales bacterium]